MSSASAFPRARDQLHGWCVACRAVDDFTPAVDAGLQACQAHLRLLPRRSPGAGQLQMAVDVTVVPPALRAPYATGEQQWCSDCVAAGLAEPRQGMSERTAGDPTPLCMTCWRSRSDRARRRRGLSPEQAGWVADLQVRLACEVCGRSGSTGDCWRCGDQVSFLAAARAVHEHDQAQLDAEHGRVDVLVGEHRAALDEVGRRERRLQEVIAWRERVEQVVAALPRLTKTGSRGRLQVARDGTGWSRAWWLLADFLARDAADRRRKGLSRRGRPSQLPLVVAVMAIAASRESGRRAMRGLSWTALFAGVAERTVTTGWARTVELGCAERVEQGRILTVDERRELGRHRQRAVYDFAHLHRSPVDAQPYLAAAAALLAQLLERAELLVGEHQALVDDATAAAAAVEAELLDVRAWLTEQDRDDLALQAAVDPAWTRQAEQAAKTALQARARATRTAASPTDPLARTAAQRAARAAGGAATVAVDNAFEQARRMANFCDHPRSGPRTRSSSGWYWGLLFSAKSSPLVDRQRPSGRGEEHRGGAARPASTRRVPGESTSSHPRTLYGVHRGSPGRPRRSGPPGWAKELAAALAQRWEFLQRYLEDAGHGGGNALAVARARGLRLCRIAATLASRLGPDWREHADDVVRLVERYAGIFSVISPGDAHSPLAYLARMLDKALSNPHAVVPWPSPVRDRVTAATAAANREADLAYTAALRTALDDRDTAAAAARAGAQTGLAAARAAAAAAGGRELPRPTQPGDPDDDARMAAARAEIAQLAAAGDDWPVEAQPGAGLPDGWRHGDAR
jgi:hypothetical protein